MLSLSRDCWIFSSTCQSCCRKRRQKVAVSGNKVAVFSNKCCRKRRLCCRFRQHLLPFLATICRRFWRLLSLVWTGFKSSLELKLTVKPASFSSLAELRAVTVQHSQWQHCYVVTTTTIYVIRCHVGLLVSVTSRQCGDSLLRWCGVHRSLIAVIHHFCVGAW